MYKISKIIKILKNNWLFFSILIIFTLLYSLSLDSYGMFMWDEAEYATIGRSIYRGEGYTISGEEQFLRPPILPLMISLTIAITHSTNDTIVKIPILISAVTCILAVYFSVKYLVDKKTAILSAILLGIIPDFWTRTAYLLTEIPYMLFFFLAVIFFYLGINKNVKMFYLSWISFSLAILTRYTALLFFPLIIIILIIYFFKNKGKIVLIVKNIHFYLSILTSFIIYLPWLIREWLIFGDPLIGFKAASGQLPSWSIYGSPFYQYLIIIPNMISTPLFILLLIGIFITFKSKNEVYNIITISILVIIIWMSHYAFKEPRQISSILPFTACLSSIGLSKFIIPLVKGITKNDKTTLILVILGLIIIGWQNFIYVNNYMHSSVALGYPSFKDAMTSIKNNTPPNTILMGPNVAQMYWYSERKSIFIPLNKSSLLNELNKTDLLIITNFERAQPEYIINLINDHLQELENTTSVKIYKDNQFITAIINSKQLYKLITKH